jgi:ATP-binding cassette subfamily F protein 3
MDKIEVPPDEKTIHFNFKQPKASGRTVVEFLDVAKSYGEKCVFKGVHFVINRGDRIALVGVNGAGKSTLIKLLAGIEPPTAGEFKLGHNVEPDYFAQDQYKELDVDARMIDDLSSVANRSQTELRGLLGCFLFSGDDAFKHIGVLSGGERNRYALARMLMVPHNFLLLDEPTNHLDMRAKDVLLEALEKFTGTVVFVSHDRYFIDKLATRIFEIADGEVRVFPGNYEDYLWRKQGKPSPGDVAQPEPEMTERVVPPEPKTLRVNPIRLRQMKDRSEKIEEEIEHCETDISNYEAQLVHFKSAEESIRLNKLLEEHRSELAELLKEWEEVSAVLQAGH